VPKEKQKHSSNTESI